MAPSTKKLLIFLAVATLLRLFYIGLIELTPDEAYYWTWATQLDWCYYDQPAGIAIADKFFTALFGTTEFGLRIGAIILGLIGSFFVWATARRVGYSEKGSAWAVVLLHVLPLTASGHVLMLHDTVMITMATALVYVLVWALFGGSFWLWIIAGLLAAAALYGKFSAVVLAPGLILFLLICKNQRSWFKKPGPYVASIIAAGLFAPVIIWNAQNHWIAALAVQKLATKPDLSFGGRILNIFDFAGSQAALVTPVLFLLMLIAAVRALRGYRNESSQGKALLGMLFFSVLGYFLLQCLRAKVQGNWAALAYVPGCVLLGGHYFEQVESGERKFVLWGKIGFAIAVAATVVVTVQPVWKIIPLPDGKDMTDQVHGWQGLAARVDYELAKNPDLVLAARRYQVAGQLMFYCKGHPRIYVANWSSRGNQFDLWNDWKALEGKSVLYVDVQGKSGKLWRHFESAEPQPDFHRLRNGRPVQTVHLTVLRNFHIDGPLTDYFSDPLLYSAQKMKNRLAKND